MKKLTTPGRSYVVLSTAGCTATTEDGKLVKNLAAGQDFFTAMTGTTIISDDNASVIESAGSLLSVIGADQPNT